MRQAALVYFFSLFALFIAAATGAPASRRLDKDFMYVGEKLRAAGHGMDAIAFFSAAAEKVAASFGENADVAYIYTEIGNTSRMVQRYGAAEEMLRRALAIFTKELPPGDINAIRAVNDLGLVYMETGRHIEAHAAFDRVIASVGDTTEGALLTIKAEALNNRGAVSIYDGRLDEARDSLVAALAVGDKAKAKGFDVYEIEKGAALNLSYVFLQQDKLEDAARAATRARALIEKIAGPQNFYMKDVLYREAQIAERQQDWDGAAAILRRQIGLLQQTGVKGGTLANSYELLARVSLGGRKIDDALQASAAAARETEGDLLAGGKGANIGIQTGYGAARSARGVYETQVAVFVAAAAREESNSVAERRFLSSAFEAAQKAHDSNAAKAVNDLGARLAAGTDALAALLRRRQDLVVDLKERQANLTSAVNEVSKTTLLRGKAHVTRRKDVKAEAPLSASPFSGSIAPLEDKLEATRAALEQADTQLRSQFPKFASYSHPPPVSDSDLAALLKPHEALLVTLSAEQATYLWYVTREASALRIDPVLTSSELSRRVAALRRSVDASPEGLRRLLSKPYDLAQAKDLYDRLLGQFLASAPDVDHLIVVADGPLLSLPFSALVTQTPPQIRDFSDYRRVSWLARSHSVSILPSVAAMTILRRAEAAKPAPEPFLGLGAPVPPTQAGATDALAEQLSKLPQLPEAKTELETVAKSLGAAGDSLLIGAAATRQALQGRDLTKYRVLFFATHGLTPDELPGLAEPALLLSHEGPDLGLLTASDIAALQINANFVVLSACSTAGADGSPGGEGLSGLARAFLYAGAKSLLVSHWPIESAVAARVTVATIRALAVDPHKGRDGALRQAIVDIIDDGEHPEYAHPVYWAPFELVGLPEATVKPSGGLQ